MQFRRTRGSAWTVIAIIVAIIVVLIFVAPRIMVYYFLNKQIRENPQLALTPQPLPPAPELQAKPTTIREFGIELAVPWGEPGRRHTTGYSSTFEFIGGHVVHVHNPSQDRSLLDTVNDLPDAQQRDAIRKMYGLEGVTTRYDAFKKMMETKPQLPSLFSWYETQGPAIMTITEKLQAVPAGTTTVYQMEIGGLRGFQAGVPGADWGVEVNMFDAADQRYHIKFQNAQETQARVTQSEINFIVRSLRRAPAETAAPTASGGGKTPGKSGSTPPKKVSAPAKSVP